MIEEQPGRIGRYNIVSELGRGGFGRVYRGYDPTVGRPVAVKILTQVSEDSLTRFRNEAAVAGNLGHRNIVTVYEYGTHKDLPFLAMEYLEGQDLHQIIASRQPLSLLKKCNIMSEVAEGLHCAHQGGVVHRDMKPGNIMVLRDGAVKIMDFGIARLTGSPDATRLTQQGYVIGTLRYMAPEQLAGSDFDALCDIFAYGVVFYELLAGRHPFEAPDAQSLMYKLTFEEPPPIRTFVPDVPEALQEVLLRIIHKDRARRYQSLREVQFDTEPIRIDLQKGYVAGLLKQVQTLIGRNEWEPAQRLVHEALAMDPSNGAARALRVELKQQLQRRSSQGKRESSVRLGEEHLVQRRFTDAVLAFEQALVADPGNSSIQSRIERARGLAEQARRAAQLLVEARKELEERNVTAAYRSVSMALRHDPRNPEAAEFLKTIQSYIEGRQAEQRVDDIIRKVQGLMLIPDYEQAIEALTPPGPDGESPRLLELLERVRAEKYAHERKQKMRNEMARATDLLRDHHLEDAAQCLENLQREFPGDPEVSKLLAYTRREQAALARTIAVERVAREARGRAESRDFEGALGVLDRALREHPGESMLIRLLSSMMAAKDTWERQQAVESILANAESLRSRQRYEEAVRVLETALEQYAGEHGLLNLLRQVHAEWSEQRRAETVRRVCGQADVLLRQGRPDAALRIIEPALAAHPGDGALSELLRRARDAVQAQEKAQAVGAAGSEAARHAAVHEFDEALRILDRGLETWRNDPDLLRQRSAVLEEKLAWERQAQRAAAIEKLGGEARVRADTGDFDGALKILDQGLWNWPDASSLRAARDTVLAMLEERAKRERALRDLEEIRASSLRVSDSAEPARLLSLAVSIASQHAGDEEIQTVVAAPIALLSDIGRVHKELAERNFQPALDICDGYLAQYPDHAAFRELKREVQRAQASARVNENYRRAAAEPDLERRAAMLQELLEHDPEVPAIEDELRLTRNKLALVQAIVEKAHACEKSGLWAEAAEQWESLLTIYDRYPGLNAQIARVQRAREEATVNAIDGYVQQIEQACQANDPGRAAELLRQARAEHPRASRLQEVAVQLQQGGKKVGRARVREARQTDDSDAGDIPQAIADATTAAGAEPDPSKQPRKRKGLLPIIGLGVALSGGIFTARVFRRPGEVTVNITADVPGASVSVGARRCVTPNCELRLTPGSYTLEANADGHQAVRKQFTIGPRQTSAVSLHLVLEPLTQVLQVNTNFGDAQVYIDGRLGGTLADGTYTMPGMTPGRHTIRVTGSGANFEGEWKVAAGAAPELLRLSAGKDVDAAMVAVAGATGSLACNCVNQPVTLDGIPVAHTPGSAGLPVELHDLKPGTRQVALGERNLIIDIGANPTLNVVVWLDRTAVQAYLEIGGSVAGARVSVDGQAIGETDRNGAFRHAVASGGHTIELSKQDYAPIRLTGKFLPGKVLKLGRAQVAMVKVIKGVLPDPRQIEAQDWAQIANSGNTDDFEAFLRDHPDGTHGEQARSRLAELGLASQAKAARQLEQSAWDKVDQNNREQLQNHLARFAAGIHAQEARARIAELDRLSAEATASRRQREEKDVERAKNAAGEQAVLNTLKEFESAYNRRDLTSLQLIWAEVPAAAYRQQFREAANLKFQLQIVGQPTLNGSSAVATCIRTLTYQGRSGGPQTHSERVSVRLSLESSGWRIRSINAN